MGVVALAGGVGAAKFLRGLVRVVSPEELTIVGNVGDDVEIYGLHVSPDLDIIMYTLAGIVDEVKGWGVAGDTFNCLETLAKLGFETWFKIGDRDLAVHIARTKMLRDGMSLSHVTAYLCRMLGVKARLIPATDDPLKTKIQSGERILDFQDYFVRRGTVDIVTRVFFEGADKARAAPGVLEAIRSADRIIICPSNPVLSIWPILSIQSIMEELRAFKGPIIGVSPIVGGKALKGPADRVMASLGFEASAYGVAKFYDGLLTHLVIDEIDRDFRKRIEELGLKVTVTNTLMKSLEDSVSLAKTVIEAG
ncbi:MAG: 2-phospho-L-lactate transferase, partial [Candidatus Bathyarchaeia archaeon]